MIWERQVRKVFTVGLAASAVLVGALVASDGRPGPSGLSEAHAAAPAGSVLAGLRRMTEQQYRQSIAQVFGREILVAGRFEPEARVDGLLATGSSTVSITPAGMEGYKRLADNVAAQTVNEANRARLIPCAPKSPTAADAACAQQVIGRYGKLLFRRPLTSAELSSRVDLASRLATESGDFYAGLNKAIASLLMAPDFLFRVELANRTPEGLSLDGYGRAQRLSFLLWDGPPDDELLRAAASGELQTEAGLGAQVDRMLASPRLEGGMRAFFSDMLHLDRFETLSKDSEIYPNYSDRVAASAQEETLRVMIDHTLTRDADYRDILTTKKTFINRALASIYQAPYGFKSDWEAYEFPADAPRSGVLTQATFLAMFSHPGRSSPTIRGVALHEVLMCEPTPPPPADVDFTIINDASDPTRKTVRSRLLAHATNPACASCHNRSDPIGLSLENFDSIGQFRTLDNGDPVDASAKLGDKSFVGAVELGKILRDDPKMPACLARNVVAYGSGARLRQLDRTLLATARQSFAASGYKLKALLKTVATQEAFYRLMPARPDELAPRPPGQVAANAGVGASAAPRQP